MNSLSSREMLLMLSAVAVGLVIFYGYVLTREALREHRLSLRLVLTLWLFRIAVALLALVALARPAYRRVNTEERLPVVPLLVDESLSMAFPDTLDNPLVQANPVTQRTRYHTAVVAVQKLQEKLTRTHRVRVYTFSDALKLLRELPYQSSVSREELFAGHPLPTGGYSNMGDALTDALRDLSGEKVAGVVLLSDGRQTGGIDLGEAAEQAMAARVPVHTVVLGSEFPLRDLRIDEVAVGAEASLGDVLTFHVKVTNQISSPLTTELLLEEKTGNTYRELARRPLKLNRGQQVVPIATVPEVEGERTYRLSLPKQSDEVNTDNNAAEVTVKVVKRTLKVLLIAGQPSREFYYMVPALFRDPIVELSCYLQSADIDYVQQGNTVIDKLPATLKDWQRYDVAILSDIDPNGITTQQLAGLESMVSKGGGLMVLAGRTHGLAKLVQVHAAKVRGLLPVEVDKNLHLDHDRVYERGFKVQRTSKGKSHPILLAAADPTANEEIWDSFGKLDFYRHHPIESLKPKAISLVERAGDNACLMATHRYEDGAVFFCGLDSLWRWRYPAESYDYDRLWTRVVRYLGEARLMGTQQQVALASDRRTYSPGEDAQLTLRVLTDPALLAQLAGQTIHVSVTGEDKDQFMVPLTADTRGEPVYHGTYRARRVGTMALRARQSAPQADSEAKPLFDVAHSFQVRMQSLEDADTSADLKAMEALSDRTGGLYFDYRTMTNLDSLVEAIPTDRQVLTETTVVEVWDGVLFMSLFVLLASAELCLRKWWGLL